MLPLDDGPAEASEVPGDQGVEIVWGASAYCAGGHRHAYRCMPGATLSYVSRVFGCVGAGTVVSRVLAFLSLHLGNN